MPLENFIVGPLYFIIVLLIAFALRTYLAKGDMERSYYMKAFFLKIGSATFFTLIYHYYYKGGDTLAYYFWANQIVKQLFTNPTNTLQFLFTDDVQAFYAFKYGSRVIHDAWIMKYNSREVFLIKGTGIVSLFALNTYISTAYLFGLFSFVSNWLLYKAISHRFQDYKKVLLISILFIPSVAFWGTGILKDTVTFSALCIITYTLHRIFVLRKGIQLVSLLALIIASYVIINLKGYILLAFLPAAAIWILGETKDKISSNVIRKLITPALYTAGVVGVLLLINTLGNQMGKFSPDEIDNTIVDFQRWHSVRSADGSAYELHVTGTSIPDMIKVFPAAVNVTFFRPYLWEAKSLVVLLAAIESLFFFFLFLYLFFIRGKIVYFLRAAWSDPIIQMCLIFSLVMGFFVGFISFNFGALARYKIPIMPYFSVFLALCAYKIKEYRNENKISLRKEQMSRPKTE